MCLCAIGPKKKKYDELSSKQYIDITYLPYPGQLMLCVHINVVKQVQNAIMLTLCYTQLHVAYCKLVLPSDALVAQAQLVLRQLLTFGT